MINYKLLTMQEFCERYAVSKHTVYKWISLGTVPYTKIGSRSIRFIPKDIEEWEKKKSLGKVKVDLI